MRRITNIRTLRKGDKVIYVSGSHGDAHNNPLWGGECGQIKGTVVDLPKKSESSEWVKVKWDNGSFNSYQNRDLAYAEKLGDLEAAIQTEVEKLRGEYE